MPVNVKSGAENRRVADRPGIFQARPLVVVTPQISPFELMPSQLIVPCMFSSRQQSFREHIERRMVSGFSALLWIEIVPGSVRRFHSSHCRASSRC